MPVSSIQLAYLPALLPDTIPIGAACANVAAQPVLLRHIASFLPYDPVCVRVCRSFRSSMELVRLNDVADKLKRRIGILPIIIQNLRVARNIGRQSPGIGFMARCGVVLGLGPLPSIRVDSPEFSYDALNPVYALAGLNAYCGIACIKFMEAYQECAYAFGKARLIRYGETILGHLRGEQERVRAGLKDFADHAAIAALKKASSQN